MIVGQNVCGFYGRIPVRLKKERKQLNPERRSVLAWVELDSLEATPVEIVSFGQVERIGWMDLT